MQHANFIFASYGIAAFVLMALIAWVALDYRALTHTLADYEKRGVARGSRRKKK